MQSGVREFRELVRAQRAKSLTQLKSILDLSWLSRKDYKIVNTPELLDWVIDCIRNARIISVDTETTGLNICSLSRDNPLKDKMVGMSISWERDQGIYIPFEHVMFDNIDKGYALRKLKPYLESKSIVAHNGIFDMKVFYDEGILLNVTQDTMLMHFNLDSTVSKGSKGLKAITRRLYKYDVIELGDIFESESDAGLFKFVDIELCKAYACADTDHTLMVFLDSFEHLSPGQRRAYALDIKVSHQLARSEYYGKGIDMELLQYLHSVNIKDLERLETLIYRYTGQMLAAKHGGDASKSVLYRFNIGSAQDVGYVLFDLLGYPVPQELGDSRSVNKYTLNALIKVNTTEEDEIFDALVPGEIFSCIDDLSWVHESDKILIERKAIANKQYKLAVLIKRWRKLEKLRSSFFMPLIENNYEGKYFSSISMTRAETGRLVDFIQTLDKSLKKLVVPYDSKKQYLVDFDFAQIEYRKMVGLSKMHDLKVLLDDPEKDFHREGGSLILNKPPESITSAERSSLKSVNFGIPYGMSAHGILQNRSGIGLTDEERKEQLKEIETMLVLWHKGMWPIANMLNRCRDIAVTPVQDDRLPPHLKGKAYGIISNHTGRTRLFDLSDLSKQKVSAIRRKAGNYPIQSEARETYCKAFVAFCNKCIQYGLMDKQVPDDSYPSGYRLENKIFIMAYIHDECLMTVDNTVNYEFIYKLIYENCMIEIPDHPKYYCGINIIDNWYEGKDDKFEAPVKHVMNVCQGDIPIFCKDAGSPKEEALLRITEYMKKRTLEELVSLDARVAEGIFDMKILVPKFTNYFVVPRVPVYFGLHRKPSKEGDDFKIACIETVALAMFESPWFIYSDNRTARGKQGQVVFYETHEKEKSEWCDFDESDMDDNEIEQEVNVESDELKGVEFSSEGLKEFEEEYSGSALMWGFKNV